MFWMPFGMVSGVGDGMGVLDGVHVPLGELGVSSYFSPISFNGVFFTQKCIRLVHEKLAMFCMDNVCCNRRFLGFPKI